jgi:hypothetical protein
MANTISNVSLNTVKPDFRYPIGYSHHYHQPSTFFKRYNTGEPIELAKQATRDVLRQTSGSTVWLNTALLHKRSGMSDQQGTWVTE